MTDTTDLKEKMRVERERRERERVAALQAAALVEQWDAVRAASKVVDEAKAAHEAARDLYVAKLAEALKITLGMRVTRTRKRGHLNRATMLTQTFVVTKFALGYFDPTTLILWGRTIRKDGTPGEIVEIGSDWEREPVNA